MNTTEFDTFLSHNSKDKPAIRELADALLSRGLRPWLDERELVPGRPWQEALEEIIQTTKTAVVAVGPQGLGPWEEPEMRACLSEFVSRKLPVIPVLLPGAPSQPELPLFLKPFTWVDLRDGLLEEGLARLEWGITGKKPSSFPSLKSTTHAPVTTESPRGHLATWKDKLAYLKEWEALATDASQHPALSRQIEEAEQTIRELLADKAQSLVARLRRQPAAGNQPNAPNESDAQQIDLNPACAVEKAEPSPVAGGQDRENQLHSPGRSKPANRWRLWCIPAAVVLVLSTLYAIFSRNSAGEATVVIESISAAEFVDKYFTAKQNSNIPAFRKQFSEQSIIAQNNPLRLYTSTSPSQPVSEVRWEIRDAHNETSRAVAKFKSPQDLKDFTWIEVSGNLTISDEGIPVISNASIHNRMLRKDGCTTIAALRNDDTYVESLGLENNDATEPYNWVNWRCRILYKDPSARGMLSFVCPISDSDEDCLRPEDNSAGPIICVRVDEKERQRVDTDDLVRIEGRIKGFDGMVITLDNVTVSKLE